MNIVTRPHMRHNYRVGVSEEKRRSVQYAMDKRREERGTTVIHVHEKPPRPKSSMPGNEEAEPMIRAFYEAHGRLPSSLVVPFEWEWKDVCFLVSGLPGLEDNITAKDVARYPYLYSRPGHQFTVRVVPGDALGFQ